MTLFFFFFRCRRGGPCWVTGCGVPGAGPGESSSSRQRGARGPARAGGGLGCYGCCPKPVPPDSETRCARLQLPPGVREVSPAEMDHSLGERDKRALFTGDAHCFACSSRVSSLGTHPAHRIRRLARASSLCQAGAGGCGQAGRSSQEVLALWGTTGPLEFIWATLISLEKMGSQRREVTSPGTRE